MSVAALTQSVRPVVVLKYLGELFLVLSVLSAAPLGAALYFREGVIGFRCGLVVCLFALAGALLIRLPKPERVQANEGMVVVALIFLLAPLAMAYPVTAAGLHFSAALFETISGITTTGLSMVPHVEGQSRTFLFLRAWMQWYGGLGIMVLSLALFVEPSGVTKGLASGETENDEDLASGMRTRARRIITIYSVLTVLSIALFWLSGMGVFNSLVYAFAAVSTGGFAPHDSSLAGLPNAFAQVSVVFACFLGAVPLSIYYGLGNGRRRPSLTPVQVKALVLSGICLSLFLIVHALSKWPFSAASPFLNVPLLVFSAQTTAGFSSVPIEDLSGGFKGILIVAMAIGGGVGSTAGGFKILRLLIFLKLVALALQRVTVPPHALVEPRLGGRLVDPAECREALVLILVFFTVVTLSWLAFLLMGYDAIDSLFEVVSATATVGLSSGLTSAGLPGFLQAVLCLDMLMGRLEFFAWFVLLYPRTWFGPSMEVR